MSANSCRIGAMKDIRIGVASICVPKSYVVFDNGLQLPILRWLDADRKECQPDEDAHYYEFGNDENGYGVGSYDAYDMPSWSDH
ncbi:hypothetical protein NKJ04_17585 [Mesorhizobium sp. M0618]|uniref:hypothetical protein n=1 Tax=Mesorhizobium sp. M0618 TaxID=2956972 RepID=UPI00333D4C1C